MQKNNKEQELANKIHNLENELASLNNKQNNEKQRKY